MVSRVELLSGSAIAAGFIEKPVVNISGKTAKSTSSGNEWINCAAFSRLAALCSQRTSNCIKAIFIVLYTKLSINISHNKNNKQQIIKFFDHKFTLIILCNSCHL